MLATRTFIWSLLIRWEAFRFLLEFTFTRGKDLTWLPFISNAILGPSFITFVFSESTEAFSRNKMDFSLVANVSRKSAVTSLVALYFQTSASQMSYYQLGPGNQFWTVRLQEGSEPPVSPPAEGCWGAAESGHACFGLVRFRVPCWMWSSQAERGCVRSTEEESQGRDVLRHVAGGWQNCSVWDFRHVLLVQSLPLFFSATPTLSLLWWICLKS